MKDSNTKKVVMVGMLCAVAYVAMCMIHLKLVASAPFLTYDPKDAVIVTGGFLFGPVYGVIISVIVSFLELVTVSTSGVIGFLMNVTASAAYALPATIIYKKTRDNKGLIAGLIAGTLCLTAVMLLWNYLIAPIYMGVPRETVAKMLVPAFLPFNFLKGAVNSVLAFIIFPTLQKTLKKTGLL